MSNADLGNRLNGILRASMASLFEQGELAELTYGAFNFVAAQVRATDQPDWTVSFPVGYKPDRTTIQSERKYTKEELIQRYEFLAIRQLSINEIIQFVTIVDAMLSDVLRAVVSRYPHKLGGKRTVTVQAVLESGSLEEVHLRATDSLINELSYKSPSEFADTFEELVGVNLLECPSFHRYVEIKASRDIFIHNRGIANAVYARKAGSHLRVQVGSVLPADSQYLLESYEHCLQLSEWLQKQLHMLWHSTDYEESRKSQLALPLPSGTPPDAPLAPSNPAPGA
ncbi:MAG TPA: hypothetical protein VEB19_03270 [Gemmatimonadaceae bacterium]|nr:hypothetical protein [Gemmatimonadaceae bacterium]